MLVSLCIAVPVVLTVSATLVCLALNFRTPAETDISKSALLATPPLPLAGSVTIKVVTFNIWDLPPLGSHRAERMQAIGRRLAELDPDIIGFQEAFYEGDRRILLKELAQAGLTQSRYFRSGFVGSGLLVVSRFAIEEAFFRRYSQWGKPHRIWYGGDWWAGKGVCLVRLKLPGAGGSLDVFNTHAHARYSKGEFDGIVLSNLKECAAFINEAATKAVPVICMGDFNARLESPQGKALIEDGGLVRAMAVDSGVDHIFIQADPRYEFNTLATTPIQEMVETSGGKVRLSDHTGYMSEIRIARR